MSLTPIVVAEGAGTSSTVSAYTVPQNFTLTVEAMSVCNPTSGTLTFSVWFRIGTDRAMISAHEVGAGDTYECPEVLRQSLPAGAVVKINAAVGLDYWTSGIVFAS